LCVFHRSHKMKGMSYPSRFRLYAERLAAAALRWDVGLILAALIALFVIQPLLQPGLPTLADLPIHLYRTLEYKLAWADGVIVPRWAPNLAYGYGYPLFIFAPPLPHWLALAFEALGLPPETAFKSLIILTILLYAIGMYLLVRDLFNSPPAGLVAAAAYTLAPFALREALLYGGNIPQYLAIGLFPWTLWAMTRAARARSWGWTILAAGFYAGVMLSHLFQVLAFTPVVAAYGLLLIYDLRFTIYDYSRPSISRPPPPSTAYRLPSTVYPLAVLPLGLLLSAFFWLPAFVERAYTRAQADIYLTKSPFYVRFPDWPELIAWIQPLDARAANPYVPLSLGVVTLILAALGLAAAVRDWRLETTIPAAKQSAIGDSPSANRHSLFAIFFTLVAAAGIFLALPISRPVWETITILQVAEFPWRMLGLANLGLSVLAGAAVLWLPIRWRWVGAGLGAAALLLAAIPLLYPVTGFTRYDEISLARQMDYERRSQSIGTTTLGEYLPLAVTQTLTGSPLVEAFLAGQNPERLDRASLPPTATATRLEQTAVKHAYRLNSPTNFTLRLFQFNFPGWQAQVDGQSVSLAAEPETGLILVNLPAGEHTLTVHFGETPLRQLALAVSGAALVGIVGLAVYSRLIANRRGEKGRVREGEKEKSPLLLHSPVPLLVMLGLVAAALWLKPLLRPVFTLDSPPGQALSAQQSTYIQFENGIELIGCDLNRRVLSPGDRLAVALYWQTQVPLPRVNLQPFVHLDRLDTLTTVAGSTNYTPGDTTTESVLPTFHWDTARYVRDEHAIIIPPGAPPLAYALRVGLIDPDQQGRLIPLADGSGDTATLGIIHITPAAAPPRLAQPLEITFGQSIHLTGFELGDVTSERLNFKLAWRAGSTPPADYTVFAQLLNSTGQLVTSFDRPPLDGAYPTSTWLPGPTIIDPRVIPLNGVPSGQYRLIIGLYDPLTGQRLATSSGSDFVELTKVTLER
jgi:hypothetical protein